MARRPGPGGHLPRPRATRSPTARSSGAGRGIWFDSGVVYVATTSDNRIHAYDTRRRRIEVIYDAGALTDPPLTGVDNVTVSRSGDLYVCEDNGTGVLDLGLITPRREVARFLTAMGPQHAASELSRSHLRPLRRAAVLHLHAG